MMKNKSVLLTIPNDSFSLEKNIDTESYSVKLFPSLHGMDSYGLLHVGILRPRGTSWVALSEGVEIGESKSKKALAYILIEKWYLTCSKVALATKYEFLPQEKVTQLEFRHAGSWGIGYGGWDRARRERFLTSVTWDKVGSLVKNKNLMDWRTYPMEWVMGMLEYGENPLDKKLMLETLRSEWRNTKVIPKKGALLHKMEALSEQLGLTPFYNNGILSSPFGMVNLKGKVGIVETDSDHRMNMFIAGEISPAEIEAMIEAWTLSQNTYESPFKSQRKRL